MLISYLSGSSLTTGEWHLFGLGMIKYHKMPGEIPIGGKNIDNEEFVSLVDRILNNLRSPGTKLPDSILTGQLVIFNQSQNVPKEIECWRDSMLSLPPDQLNLVNGTLITLTLGKDLIELSDTTLKTVRQTPLGVLRKLLRERTFIIEVFR